jgi:hypothetical protein
VIHLADRLDDRRRAVPVRALSFMRIQYKF